MPSIYRPNFYQIDETNIDDLDGDGVFGSNDAFPFDAAESRDLDGDGVGDNADPDRDGDGIDDEVDAYPDSDLGELTDSDGDGAPDALPEASNVWLMDGDGSLGVDRRPEALNGGLPWLLIDPVISTTGISSSQTARSEMSWTTRHG